MSLASLSPLRDHPSLGVAVLRVRADHGRRVYDWWADHQGIYRLLVRLAFLGRERGARDRAVAALDLATGDRVLDVGCGAGVNFGALADGVGSEGRVVGLDYSAGMVSQARERARNPSRSSTPISPVRGDATALPFPGCAFDAAYATLSLSAMAEAEAAVAEIHRVLRPGGRVAVVDARPFREFPWRALNPIVTPISAYATDWHPDADVVGAIDRTFADSTTWTTNGGTLYVAVGRKSDEA